MAEWLTENGLLLGLAAALPQGRAADSAHAEALTVVPSVPRSTTLRCVVSHLSSAPGRHRQEHT